MEISDAITRLTEREKEALRLWLDHKSAKEIAIDLGVSHHAVEKRLKMARTKLGAATSRDAARMLAVAEGYGQTVAAPSDLSPPADPRPSRHHRPLVFGGLAMLTLTALGLALATAYPAAEPIEIEVDGSIERVFAHLDRNESGFLESPESPFVAIAFIDPDDSKAREGSAVIGNSDDPAQVSEFYTAADTDRDGRVSLDEYRVWSEAHWGELGIEVKTIMKVLPES
ncbi:sigma factor-like helix-turn-helix DNA-binding protein [Porphyrobacter sp. YT40]|uniref:sigma factor-like helix-turn-helix DNA-binding protein n=1 Tax=Porphyrobacter sp. YT40 TaxID=2547601 RepID=UPI0011418122|nr:sigma factor-like helix-turn-helix DNA-binding protein [Porphyrobacter sp. YT40]QDH35211.1 histidine kinase [Porphyrobacter sp. YT40]